MLLTFGRLSTSAESHFDFRSYAVRPTYVQHLHFTTCTLACSALLSLADSQLHVSASNFELRSPRDAIRPTCNFELVERQSLWVPWLIQHTCDLSTSVSVSAKTSYLTFGLVSAASESHLLPPFGFGSNLKITFSRSLSLVLSIDCWWSLLRYYP